MIQAWTKLTEGVEINNKGELKLDLEKLTNFARNLNRKTKEPNFVKVNTGTYKNNHQAKKRVICVETNQVFDSIKAAAQYNNIYSSNISSCLRGNQATAGCYHWAYYTEQQQGG